ncbi:poly(adp-ribose) glycohydrolase-like [Stylonychia lemnae]|uniref:poly(ADP-ribose) glycohydrolase n=1 Tax=Stylonychia lemnae TaxID=5949 RepID=A0A078ATX8_STYLE|nr:poly(adp-ribose) glycohydrolase-like [Stylonychia lemnae]|eukprot:CDW85411.1 poly(adp-ribose) glycohydrolase-like [Stylonychia lemnae]
MENNLDTEIMNCEEEKKELFEGEYSQQDPNMLSEVKQKLQSEEEQELQTEEAQKMQSEEEKEKYIDEKPKKKYPFPESASDWGVKKELLEKIQWSQDIQIKLQSLESLVQLQYGDNREVNLVGIRHFIKNFKEFFQKLETESSLLLSKLAYIALNKQQYFPQDFEINVLTKSKNERFQEILLTNSQVLYFMSHMFFCTTIKIDDKYNSCNFLYYIYRDDPILQQKLKFLFNYFKKAIDRLEASPDIVRRISISRNSLGIAEYDAQVFLESQKQLTDVFIDENLRIEDFQGRRSMLGDFANKYIGGGALSLGSVQEEILFLIYPELNVSALFCQVMAGNEAIIMKGAMRFSKYYGYGYNLLYAGDFNQEFNKDCFDDMNRLETTFIAIDAIAFDRQFSNQLLQRCIARELIKSYAGFVGINCQDQEKLKIFENLNSEHDNLEKKQIVTEQSIQANN